MFDQKQKLPRDKELTFASAAGFMFPSERKAPPRMTTFFTLLAKEESLSIAYRQKEISL